MSCKKVDSKKSEMIWSLRENQFKEKFIENKILFNIKWQRRRSKIFKILGKIFLNYNMFVTNFKYS